MSLPKFSFSEVGHVDPPEGWRFGAGKFTQQDRADLVGYHPSNGSLWVGRNSRGGFAFERWATLDPATGWQIVAADFTRDGRADVAAYHRSNGSVWVGEDRGDSFQFRQWGSGLPCSGLAVRGRVLLRPSEG